MYSFSLGQVISVLQSSSVVGLTACAHRTDETDTSIPCAFSLMHLRARVILPPSHDREHWKRDKKKDAGMKRKYRVNSYHLVIVKISSTERQGVSSSSQLKYVFKLEENVSWVKAQYSRRARIEGAWKQNSLFPLWPAMTFLLLLRLLPLLGEMLDNLIQSVRMWATGPRL